MIAGAVVGAVIGLLAITLSIVAVIAIRKRLQKKKVRRIQFVHQKILTELQEYLHNLSSLPGTDPNPEQEDSLPITLGDLLAEGSLLMSIGDN